jgi:hypothetical protein
VIHDHPCVTKPAKGRELGAFKQFIYDDIIRDAILYFYKLFTLSRMFAFL